MAKHTFSFNQIKPQKEYPYGSRTMVSASELPVLHKIALSSIKLKPKCAREPHWHPNADELTYCVKGKALVTIFSPKNEHHTFTLDAGEVFYVPKGYLHHICNLTDEEAEFVMVFSNERPNEINLSEAIHTFSLHALAKTFNAPEAFFEKIHEVKNQFFTAPAHEEVPAIPIPSHYKLSIEKLNPQILTQGGSAKIANAHSFPALEELALFSLRINGRGVREPHWHPNAGELNFVLKGRARLTILSPGGEVDTFEIGPREGSFIPASYIHYIENIGDEELHMTVFFSNAVPNDLGISAALSSYSDALLGALFGVPPEHFKNLPRYLEDVLVVSGGG